MQRTIKDIIISFLTIVEYPNDKEKFATEFEQLNRLEAFSRLFETLPQDIQEKIKQSKTPEEIEQYIDKETYEKELIKVTSLAFADQIKSTLPLISPEQKEKIVELLNEMQDSQSQTNITSSE